jgi:hypothetical protein
MKRELFLMSAVAAVFAGSLLADSLAQRTEGKSEQINVAQSEKISMDQLPSAARERIELQKGIAPLEEITKKTVNGQQTYEARFKNENLETRLSVAEDGSPIALMISSTEGSRIDEAAGAQRAVDFIQAGAGQTTDALPGAARETLNRQLGNVQIKSVKSQKLFDVTILNQGQPQEARIAEDGTLLGFKQLEQQQTRSPAETNQSEPPQQPSQESPLPQP